MVGLVVAAHGRLAQELVATAEQIMGKLANVATVSIEPGTPAEAIRTQMRAAVKELDHGDGVLVLAGVNLPMLLKAASLRGENIPLHDLAQALLTYAQRNIRFASELVRDAAARHAAS